MKFQLVWIPPDDEMHVGDFETFEDARAFNHNADEIVDEGKWQIHVLDGDWGDLVRVYELQTSEWKLVEDYMEAGR